MAAQRELMNEEQLVPWVLRYLGAPFLKVELTADTINDAIQDAKRWYTAKKGFQRIIFFDVVQGESEYTLPPDVEVVIDVAFASGGLNNATSIASGGFGPGYGTTDLFGGLVYTGSGIQLTAYSVTGGSDGSGMGPLSQMTLALQNLEMFSRVFSAELDWRQDGRVLRLFPVRGYPTGKIFIQYVSNMLTIEQLSERDHEILKRYVMVGCKKRLGRIRSKYPGGFGTAQGNQDLDGSTLLDEARSEEEALNEEIGESGFPMAFMVS